MRFTSVDFLLFLAIAASIFRVIPAAWRAAYVLIASYAFYCTTSPRGAIALAAATLFTYAGALWCERLQGTSRAFALTTAIVGVLVAYLMFFKLVVFVPHQGITSWIVPLGISYYSFKLISYVLDVYWGKMPAARRLIPFAAYVAFFPQILAGPIQRSDDFLSQIGNGQTVLPAILRIAWGLAKKLIVADHLATAVNYVYAHVSGLHGGWWIGFYIWPLQLYADFSALTDIAIGTGRLFGVVGPENFDRPFNSTSISEYWRRWHMSFTNWLADYLFMPLRMATRKLGNVGLVMSITINTVAIGLWHGIAWGYFIFGILHSIFISFEALTAKRRKRLSKQHPEWEPARNVLGWFMTFHLVCFALVFFRAETVSDALYLLRHVASHVADFRGIFEPEGLNSARAFLIGLLGYALLELCERYRPDRWLAQIRLSGPRYLRWSLYASTALVLVIGFALLVATSGEPKNPFVYAIF
ncbi:MAG TPA: MBOAT family O-acyltransferase [Bryobacteraceae bacterium]|jgi:D-alanyl-lipoteichoic acid acyltransferase DltB (MBOAT superfamily)|nr:MBOAT family O-acyltransferase [Bryobacteraceae bacterium]